MNTIIRGYQDKHPKIHQESFIFENTCIIGDVEIQKNCSIWFGSVLRGDINHIFIGEGSNVQDLCTIHVDYNQEGFVKIGKNVTIGHNCIIHACQIQDNVLVGMGSIIMDGAIIGEDSIIGANSLITKNKKFPPRSLILGNPAKFIRELSKEEIESIQISAEHYIKLAKSYRH